MTATPTQPATQDYDLTEARSLLAFAADEIYPDEAAAGKAVSALLETLQQVGARSTSQGIRIELDRSVGLVVFTGRGTRNRAAVAILDDEHGRIVLVELENGRTKSTRDISKLLFNPLTGMLEGTDDDPVIVPVPGAARAKRAAAAVVLEQAIKFLKEITNQGRPGE
jgi:hypothetical protein